jgi:hypothetical protein
VCDESGTCREAAAATLQLPCHHHAAAAAAATAGGVTVSGALVLQTVCPDSNK